MVQFDFAIQSANAAMLAAEPAIALIVGVKVMPEHVAVHELNLRYQVQIEAPRRRYSSDEQTRLIDLFGPPADWHRSLRSIPWCRGRKETGAFLGQTTVQILLPTTDEMQSAAQNYLNALAGDTAPLAVLFSGTAFCEGSERPLEVVPIPWDRQATFQLPISTWREATESAAAV